MAATARASAWVTHLQRLARAVLTMVTAQDGGLSGDVSTSDIDHNRDLSGVLPQTTAFDHPHRGCIVGFDLFQRSAPPKCCVAFGK